MRPAALVLLLIFLLSALTVPNVTTARTTQPTPGKASAGPPQALHYLSKGINIDNWFTGKVVQTPAGYSKRITAKDIRLLKSLGFRHIRLPIDPMYLFDETRPDQLDAERLKYLKEAVGWILAEEMAVILDMHTHSATTFDMARLATDDAFVDRFCRFLETFAAQTGPRDPQRIFFETFNEPKFYRYVKGSEIRWAAVQEKLAAALRKGAPRNTIVAKPEGDAPHTLKRFTPIKDRNVVYSIHYYREDAFTHQGAAWGGKSTARKYLCQVPFPTTPERCEKALKTVHPASREMLAKYCASGFNPEIIQNDLAEYAQWSQRYQAPLYIGEFGVLRPCAATEDRARWAQAVTGAADRHNIGWSWWDYDTAFGIVQKQDGKRRLDQTLIQALELH